MKTIFIGAAILALVSSARGEGICNDRTHLALAESRQKNLEVQILQSDRKLNSSIQKIQQNNDAQISVTNWFAELNLSAEKIDELIMRAKSYLRTAERVGPESPRHVRLVTVVVPRLVGQIEDRQKFLDDQIHEIQSLKHQVWAGGSP